MSSLQGYSHDSEDNVPEATVLSELRNLTRLQWDWWRLGGMPLPLIRLLVRVLPPGLVQLDLPCPLLGSGSVRMLADGLPGLKRLTLGGIGDRDDEEEEEVLHHWPWEVLAASEEEARAESMSSSILSTPALLGSPSHPSPLGSPKGLPPLPPPHRPASWEHVTLLECRSPHDLTRFPLGSVQTLELIEPRWNFRWGELQGPTGSSTSATDPVKEAALLIGEAGGQS